MDRPRWDDITSTGMPIVDYPPPHDLELGVSPARTRNSTMDSVSSTRKEDGMGEVVMEGEDSRGKDQVWTQGPSSTSSPTASTRGVAGDVHWAHHEVTGVQRRVLYRLHTSYTTFLSTRPRLSRALDWLSGPSPRIVETSLKPLLPKTETFFHNLFRPLHLVRHTLVPLFLIAWFLAFTFLIRASYFDSGTSDGAPSFISADNSFWDKDDGCGLNGTYCTPFTGSLIFRCPAQVLSVELLNVRAVGAVEVIYQPLVVGGGDPEGTYRADSWICPSAIHRGLIGNHVGGCGELVRIGAFEGFVGGSKNGVDSVGFDSSFPSSYRFVDGISQTNCQDLRDDILGFNVAMSTILSFIVRPAASIFYSVLLIMGFWHVVLVSDPTANPPDVATGFQYFLPTLFIGYAMWRFSWRWVAPAFNGAVLEGTVWYLGGFWVGLLINVSLAWIPIDRLTAHDIQQEPGGLVAVICVVIFVVCVVVNQLRVIRRTGWFWYYIKCYIVGGVIIGLLCCLPGLTFRLHHYFAAIVLTPGCAFVTRPSALFQGFLLGMFLDGAGRWGFDSILQTPASLVGDGALGTALPIFLTSATNFTLGQADIAWAAIPTDLVGQWDGFALIVDDVLAWTGIATNFSIASLNATLPHYFRLAYQLEGTSGDFTRAATAFLNNGTWIDAVAGAG